jgi:EpsI family protein
MKLWLRNLLLLALMLAASGMAVALRPTAIAAERGAKIDLETSIPSEFTGWRIDTSIPPIMPSPDLQATLDVIYTSTLARTYVNGSGQRVMLSIAYGDRQNDQLRVHQPEGCYLGQGFHIVQPSKATEIPTSFGPLRVTQLSAANATRHEPITYWIRIGDSIARTQWEMKKIQLSYGLAGKIPDGMLVRVSSLSTNDADAFVLHQNFIDALLTGTDTSRRRILIGNFAG